MKAVKGESGLIIGVTPRQDEERMNYRMRKKMAEWLRGSDLFPVMLDMNSEDRYICSVCSICDGILFSGGGDILPLYYHQSGTEDCFEIDEKRDAFELKLFKGAQKCKIPILGICRGAQIIAVGLGGSIVRNVEGHGGGAMHKIRSEVGNSRICRIIQENAVVNSYHHQYIELVSKGGIISAVDDSGHAEAIEVTNKVFCVGVQWHPELEPWSPVSKRLCADFAKSVKRYALNKRKKKQ